MACDCEPNYKGLLHDASKHRVKYIYSRALKLQTTTIPPIPSLICSGRS